MIAMDSDELGRRSVPTGGRLCPLGPGMHWGHGAIFKGREVGLAVRRTLHQDAAHNCKREP